MTPGRREVARLKGRLDSAFGRIDAIDVDALEARADFARYLCVLVSGYLEKAITELLFEHCRQHAGATVQRRVRKRLDRFQNPTKGNIISLMETFDTGWKLDLEVFLVDERVDAVNSIVKERHRIAHGENSDITYVRVKEYRETIETVVDHIAALVDPE